jgi:2-C-methyl-D-erythritol 2,4-cyclodiphosphate synthase
MIRTGIGYDSHRLVEGRPLVLGGIVVPHAHGLLGHSDADVLTHALCDALLGAVADGDIGQHFPDKDPQWKGADSTLLLARVVDRLARSGWRVVNVDATVVAEAPRLMSHIPAMRQRLAEVLGVELARVSVKAKTNEGMDAVGRREGISAMAVATVAQQNGERP